MVCSILMFPSADNLLLRRKLYLMFHNNKIKNIPLSEDSILNLSHPQLPHQLFRVALGTILSGMHFACDLELVLDLYPADQSTECHASGYAILTWELLFQSLLQAHAGKGIICVGKLKPQSIATSPEVQQ